MERKDFGRLALQEQNYSKLLADITKGVIEVNELVQASESIARAFHMAESGTPGPVAVILPEDIFDELTDAPMAKPRPRARPARAPRTSTSSPRCWPRPSARWSGSAARWPMPDAATLDELRQLAEQWVLPVIADASPAASVRRRPSQLRRLHGHPRAEAR